MNTTSDVLLAFAAKWTHPDDPPDRIERAEVRAAEEALGIRFPEDYVSEILSAGLPNPTRALLSAIVDREQDLPDLSKLYAPKEIIERTRADRVAGLPETLLPIGSDCMGNIFCFKEADLTQGAVSSAPIYFWDHDIDASERVAGSFPDWIGQFLGDWSEGLTYSDFLTRGGPFACASHLGSAQRLKAGLQLRL